MSKITGRITTGIWMGLLLAGLVGSAAARGAGEAGEATGGSENLSPKRLSVTVDPRIELLAVVQHFTPWAQKGHIKSNTAYKNDVGRYFGEFGDHPAVTYAESLTTADFAYDAPVQFMLHHGDPPELVQRSPYSDYLIKRAGGEENLMEFAAKLRDFARETGFMQFYEAHQPLYDTLTAEVESLLAGKDYAQALEDFYGESRDTYNFVLSPLFSGNYGIPIETGGECDLYAVVGPCSLKGTRTTFACLDYLENMTLHEWSHPFVNPLVDRNYERFEESIALFEPIKRMMQRQAYPNWRVTLYEHLVRACGEIHIRSKLHQDFRKEKSLEYQEGKGFWYIGLIDSMLDVYESQRGRYPKFSLFVPLIADRLSRTSVEDLPERITAFRGPLDAVFARTDCIHLIYPTAVGDEAADMIKRELEGFAGFLSSARIEPVLMSDREALETDWGDKVAFIYGNPKNNLFWGRLTTAIPVTFREGALEFGGKRYEGEGVFLISCMPNPFNKRLPFVVCAANRPEICSGSMRVEKPIDLASARISISSGWG